MIHKNEIQKVMQIESKSYKENKMSIKRIKGEKKLSFLYVISKEGHTSSC